MENAIRLMHRSRLCGHRRVDIPKPRFPEQYHTVSLEEVNAARIASREHSRRKLFERTEADHLHPLPTVRYQMKECRTATVIRNSSVTLFKHHYSVPKEYIGKRMDIIYDTKT